MRTKILLIAGSIVFHFGQPCSAREFTGEVITVPDGDTFTVKKDDGKKVKVRVFGVDAPESDQEYGQKAKEFLKDLVLGKKLILDPVSKSYGRSVCICYLEDGTPLNEKLIGAGMAWWYWSYSESKELRDLFIKAIQDKRGLWSQDAPIPPWDWRRGERRGDDHEDSEE